VWRLERERFGRSSRMLRLGSWRVVGCRIGLGRRVLRLERGGRILNPWLEIEKFWMLGAVVDIK